MMPEKIGIQTVTGWVRQFAVSPEIAGPVDQLLRAFPVKARPYIVGGALRNRIIEKIHGKAPVTRDIDLFVGDVAPVFPLEHLFRGFRFEPTELGGIRWYPENTPFVFDVCLLSQFIVLKRYGLSADVTTLLTVLDFDVNAAIFDPLQNTLHENRCIEAITRKTMGFNTRRFVDKDLLIYRILAIQHKIGFMISRAIFHFLKSSVDMDAMNHVRAILVSKFGRSVARAILKTFDEICRLPDYTAYLESQKTTG